LAAAVVRVGAFRGGGDGIAIEVSRALLQFREVFPRLKRALRPKQSVDIHPAQTRRIDPMAMLLRTDVANEVSGAVGVTVGMAVEARHAAVRLFGASVAGHVELLLWKRGEQKPQSVELLGIENAVEELHEVVDRHALSFRHISEIGPGS